MADGSAHSFWRCVPDGVVVRVRVTPRGGRDQVEGPVALADGGVALGIRVSAAPSDGAANEAVRRCLATALKRPAGTVTLVGGAASRVKSLAVAGEPDRIAVALENLGVRSAAA